MAILVATLGYIARNVQIRCHSPNAAAPTLVPDKALPNRWMVLRGQTSGGVRRVEIDRMLRQRELCDLVDANSKGASVALSCCEFQQK